MDNEQTITEKKSYAKRTNYASQKRYAKKHPEQRKDRDKRYKAQFYSPKINIPKEYRDDIMVLSNNVGLSVNMLFITAVEEKYGVILHKENTENDEKND